VIRFLAFVALLGACLAAPPAPAAVPAHGAVAEAGAPLLARGTVAAPESVASEAGAAILRAGGNAVDAAIAFHFALAVTCPRAGNFGGGGFMLVYTDSGDVAIDYRETAPAAATRDLYLGAAGEVVEGLSLDTHRAAGLPGSGAIPPPTSTGSPSWRSASSRTAPSISAIRATCRCRSSR
jgi:gamma-glutamyltranspeptidase/glutathione hydrolase